MKDLRGFSTEWGLLIKGEREVRGFEDCKTPAGEGLHAHQAL